ncbi:MAG TPA: thioredoxin domain-containing protein, partial [Candidatus Limnocylindrales bacterium]|nr:thioredoxin domain-containing protein [Candidatus Limnocylindrales bacterium]
RDFAFIGPESTAAAVAARCASAQEAFWPYHDRLFAAQGAENSGVYGTSALIAISRSLGLDGVRFEACLADPVLHRQVAAETEAGRSRGVVSTPTLDFGGRAIAGVPRYEALDALVRQLADAGDPP